MNRSQIDGADLFGSTVFRWKTLIPNTRALLIWVVVIPLALSVGCAAGAFAQVTGDGSSASVLQPVSPLSTPAASGISTTTMAQPNTRSPASESLDESSPQSAVYQWAVVLPTYPLDKYRTTEVDAEYNWPYYRFDRERFLEDDPPAVNQAHRVIILENELLRVLILPDLGGRIWQVIHKPTGAGMFYQNPVVKPSPWGPANQLGWLGLGGLEWNLPVNEHGYDWGTPWDVRTFVDEDGAAVAQISTPADGRYLAATIEVRLPSDAAYIEIEPHIQNISEAPLQFDYWHNAMLAPGPGNQLGPELRFIIPGDVVQIHSSGDERLPVAGSAISWPMYNGREMSRLGNWDQYVGFFEYPAAQGPYTGVYDPAADAAAVRIYPAEVARGSKVFGLGWSDALTSEYYTDDGSAYVELHGGLAPTFSDKAQLDAGESVQWKERWYPVNGIGEFSAAGDAGALSVELDQDALRIGFYPTESFTGQLIVKLADGREVVRRAFTASAGVPMTLQVNLDGLEDAMDSDKLTVNIVDDTGAILLSYALGVP